MKSEREKILYNNVHIRNVEKGTDEPICRAGMEIQMKETDLWTQRGKLRVGRIEKVALTYIHYLIK